MARVPAVLDPGSDPALKIAIVCPYAWDRPGGVQSHCRALATALRDAGEDVRVFAPYARRARSPRADAILVGRAVGVPFNGSVAPICFGPVAAARLRRGLTGFGPDVLHLHEPLIPSLSLLALWGSETPAVGTFHAAARSSRAYRVFAPLLRRWAAGLAVRTAVSPAAEALASRYLPGDYVISPNGVEVRRFQGAEPLEIDAAKTVLFLGRLERRKGAEVLITAVAQLTDLDVTLLIAGTGHREAACRALAQKLEVDARFLGELGEEEVARAYRTADVYCAPNLGGESFGMVLTEAMAAGAAVVCSGLEAFRTAARDAALFVPPGDASALADGLRRVLTDGSLADRLRAAGQRRANLFDWEQLVAGIELLYRKAVAMRAAR